MLTIIEQILFTIKKSNKMLIDINTVNITIEHKKRYMQENKKWNCRTKIFIYNITVK